MATRAAMAAVVLAGLGWATGVSASSAKEDDASAPASPTIAVAGHGGAGDAVRIDLNNATLNELDGLPGVGRKRAEAIMAERAKRPFRRPTELLRIKGFGPKLFARLRAFVTVGEMKRAGGSDR